MIVPGAGFMIWPVACTPDPVPWQTSSIRQVVPVIQGDSIVLSTGETVIAPISGLFYDGNFEGCDECGRTILPLGDWPAGFRPTTMRLTIVPLKTRSAYGGYNPSPYAFLLNYADDFDLSGLVSGTVYTLNANISGAVDISQFILYLGIHSYASDGDTTYGDVPFIIGDIWFDYLA